MIECGVSSICNSLQIELHLICSIVCCTLTCHASLNRTCIILGCASCHVYVMVVYHLVCFFPICFSRQLRFRSGVVRVRSTMSVCLFHGLDLLPSGISGKMTISSKSLLSLLASCSLYCYAALPITCSSSPPNSHETTSNLCHPSQKTIVWLCYRFCSAPLIALLVAGEDEVCSMLEHGYVGISQYLLFN